ncbi:toll/interleukin-1 receptor domain-containing protein [Priestia aryabhattai]|uniref:toll/interleukin-1 receptor domain-containing protein n=1 Tax=Priestia aryabhattai TaxID=412384 RepID=UPI003D7FD23C
MKKISLTIVNNRLHVRTLPTQAWHSEDGICIDFFINQDHERLPQKELLYIIKQYSAELTWIEFKVNKIIVNLNELKNSFSELFGGCEWMNGTFEVFPEFDKDIDTQISVVSFSLSKDNIELNSPKKIFLSHKGSNKEFVRGFYKVLKEIGFEPWLDDEDMPAGTNADRAILKGLKDSCACVFFITPEFKDEKYLSDEIDYAHIQKRKKEDKFRIITLQFENENGDKGIIPELLERYIWKTPKSELEAIQQILRALPIKTESVEWR